MIVKGDLGVFTNLIGEKNVVVELDGGEEGSSIISLRNIYTSYLKSHSRFTNDCTDTDSSRRLMYSSAMEAFTMYKSNI